MSLLINQVEEAEPAARLSYHHGFGISGSQIEEYQFLTLQLPSEEPMACDLFGIGECFQCVLIVRFPVRNMEVVVDMKPFQSGAFLSSRRR